MELGLFHVHHAPVSALQNWRGLGGVDVSLQIPLDDDGFMTCECPHCVGRYKLLPAEFEADDVIDLFCPYCGLQAPISESCTDEVVEAARQVVAN